MNDRFKNSSSVIIERVVHSEKYFKKGELVKVFQDLPLEDAYIIIADKVYRISYDNNEFNVTINYKIVGIDVLPQQLSFALQPTR